MSFLGAPGAARVRGGAQSKAPSIVHWNDSLWGSWPLPLPHLPSKQSAKELCLTDSLEKKGKEEEEEEGRKREEEGRKRKKGEVEKSVWQGQTEPAFTTRPLTESLQSPVPKS